MGRISQESLIGFHTSDPFGPALEKILADLYNRIIAYPDRSTCDKMLNDRVYNEYFSKIEKLVLNRFGISISIKNQHDVVGACIPYYPRADMLTVTKDMSSSTFFEDYIETQRMYKFHIANRKKSGEIDSNKVKINGALSKFTHYLYMDFHFWFCMIKCTPSEVAGIILHELGHLWTFIDMSIRTDRCNQILNDFAISMHKCEPAGKREYLLLELVDNDLLTEDEIEDLKHEERNLILGVKLFKRIYGNLKNTGLSSNYDDTAGEQLADDFATKFGYGKELASALYKVTKIGGQVGDPYSNDIWMYGIIGLLTMAFCPVFAAIAWGVALFNLILGAIFGGESDRDMTYDDYHDRLTRIRRVLVSSLKNLKLPDKVKTMTIAQIKDIDTRISSIKEIDPEGNSWICKLSNSLFYKNKVALATKQEEQVLERLASNDLFLQSAKLSVKKGK